MVWYGFILSLIIHIGFLCFLMTTPLSFVREIEKFAFSYVFADLLILVTTILILGFSTYKLTKDGWGENI